MKSSRVVILSVAVVAAGLAGLLAMQISGPQAVVEKAEAIIQKEPTVSVLVSAVNLPVGSRLDASSVRWARWPQGSVNDSYVTEEKRPDAIAELTGAIVR
ncbi:SAF domain-containing protein, partial [Agrobacterium cavarae]